MSQRPQCCPSQPKHGLCGSMDGVYPATCCAQWCHLILCVVLKATNYRATGSGHHYESVEKMGYKQSVKWCVWFCIVY